MSCSTRSTLVFTLLKKVERRAVLSFPFLSQWVTGSRAKGPGAAGEGELDRLGRGEVGGRHPAAICPKMAPSLSLAAAQERIFTAVLCVSLAETWVDFGAENYGALDSGNLLSTKRPEALSDVRREHSCWGFWRVFGNTCKAYFMTVEWDKY